MAATSSRAATEQQQHVLVQMLSLSLVSCCAVSRQPADAPHIHSVAHSLWLLDLVACTCTSGSTRHDSHSHSHTHTLAHSHHLSLSGFACVSLAHSQHSTARSRTSSTSTRNTHQPQRTCTEESAGAETRRRGRQADTTTRSLYHFSLFARLMSSHQVASPGMLVTRTRQSTSQSILFVLSVHLPTKWLRPSLLRCLVSRKRRDCCSRQQATSNS